jgi:hypothetical protein
MVKTEKIVVKLSFGFSDFKGHEPKKVPIPNEWFNKIFRFHP